MVHMRQVTVLVAVCTLIQSAHGVPMKFTTEQKSTVVDAYYGFDYVHLVQEWPGAFCDTKKGCLWPTDEPTKGFLLHGLWPEYFNGTWPEYCDADAAFNMTSLADLVDDLHTYWPSLVSADQASFWAHEWTRHGTCMEKYFSPPASPEHDFFALVLELREAFDAYSLLMAKGIGPGSTTTWTAVKMALEGSFSNKVEIGCNFDKAGKRQLLEVRTCYVPKGGVMTPIDCPNEGSATQCGSPMAPFYIPPFHPANTVKA